MKLTTLYTYICIVVYTLQPLHRLMQLRSKVRHGSDSVSLSVNAARITVTIHDAWYTDSCSSEVT